MHEQSMNHISHAHKYTYTMCKQAIWKWVERVQHWLAWLVWTILCIYLIRSSPPRYLWHFGLHQYQAHIDTYSQQCWMQQLLACLSWALLIAVPSLIHTVNNVRWLYQKLAYSPSPQTGRVQVPSVGTHPAASIHSHFHHPHRGGAHSAEDGRAWHSPQGGSSQRRRICAGGQEAPGTWTVKRESATVSCAL